MIFRLVVNNLNDSFIKSLITITLIDYKGAYNG